MIDNRWNDLAFDADIDHQYLCTAIELPGLCLDELDDVCDGANSNDHQGFAGQHTRNGKLLAAKTLAGYKWQPHDVRWLKKTIPHYMNTQLDWVDKKQFSIGILYWEYVSKINRAMFVLEQTLNTINGLIIWRNDTAIIGYYKTFPLDNIKQKDYNFMASLQIAAKKNKATSKQVYWMKKMMQKYWGKI